MKGVFAPGSLAGQGLSNLTVFGAGGTVGVTNNANLSAYTKDCKWKFKFGKWLCVLNGTAYFPSNIPAATNPNSIPRWIPDPNIIDGGTWRIDEPPDARGNGDGNGNGNGNGSDGGNNGGDLTSPPPPPPPPIRPNGNGVIRIVVGNVVVAGAKVVINNIIKHNSGSPFDQAIAKALDSNNIGTKLEGHVANTVVANGFDLVNFQKKYYYPRTGGLVSEIDIETNKAIIETTTETGGKLQQVKNRTTNPTTSPILNPSRKPVIYYAPRYTQDAEREMNKAGGLVVRTDQELIDLLDSLP